MRISEVIEYLQEYLDDEPEDDAVVLLAFQPQHPLQFSIHSVKEHGRKIYIVARESSPESGPYAPSTLWEE